MAKREAVAQGRTPPGADGEAIVERILTSPPISWSCWTPALLIAGVINAGGRYRAEVVGMRRTGQRSTPVDFHSSVLVTDQESKGTDDREVREWLVDPHFALGMIPRSGGTFARPAARGEVTTGGDGRVRSKVGRAQLAAAALDFQQFTVGLDSEDVEMLCIISGAFSGVPDLRFATVFTADGLATLVDGAEGAEIREAREPVGSALASTPVRAFDSWDEGYDVFRETYGPVTQL